jgi:hypothetical protein
MWNTKSLADRKATASEHLEASLKADDITNTTELIAETITKAKHKINNKNELQSNLELCMSNLEKMLAKQQQKNYKGGRTEHLSSLMISTKAPLQYKSHKQHNRSNINLYKDHRLGQPQITNQIDNNSEPFNPTQYKQKTKHFKPQKTYPQDQHEFKMRKIDTPNNTNNKKKKNPTTTSQRNFRLTQSDFAINYFKIIDSSSEQTSSQKTTPKKTKTFTT